MTLEVRQFRCLDDNYGFIVRDIASGETACIDTPDAEAILAELAVSGWPLTLILNTHWHPDHAGGNTHISDATGARIVGPQEVTKIAPPDRIVVPGDQVQLGETMFDVVDSSGHTHQHVTYYAPTAGMAFVGDALFPLGCGRVFEGTMAQSWAGLSRLVALPGETRIFSAHEYSRSNARFALSVEVDGPTADRARAMLAVPDGDRVTVPTTIEIERCTNPFLRPRALAAARAASSDAEAFGIIRALKDSFAG
jgi:hydroxyacylglutathione hydrolase